MAILGGVAILGFAIVVLMPYPLDIDYPSSTVQTITLAVVGVVFGWPISITILLLPCGICCFILISTNDIQFGIDQLHDAPTKDSIFSLAFWDLLSMITLQKCSREVDLGWSSFCSDTDFLLCVPLSVMDAYGHIHSYQCDGIYWQKCLFYTQHQYYSYYTT